MQPITRTTFRAKPFRGRIHFHLKLLRTRLVLGLAVQAYFAVKQSDVYNPATLMAHHTQIAHLFTSKRLDTSNLAGRVFVRVRY